MVDLFQLMGNDSRRNLLQLLIRSSIHITGAARALGVSAPVALRHVRLLEQAGLVERVKRGNLHLLQLTEDAPTRLGPFWEMLQEHPVVEVRTGATLLDTIAGFEGIEVVSTEHGAMIRSVDGVEGDYVYEVNGQWPQKGLEQFELDEDVEVEVKRLVPVVGKKIQIRVRS